MNFLSDVTVIFSFQVRDIIDQYSRMELHIKEVSDWYQQQYEDAKSQETESFVTAYKIVCMYEDELSENALIAATEEELAMQIAVLQVTMLFINRLCISTSIRKTLLLFRHPFFSVVVAISTTTLP